MELGGDKQPASAFWMLGLKALVTVPSNFYLFCLFAYLLCVSVSHKVNATGYVWRSENSLQQLVLSFCHADPGDWTLTIRLGSKRLFLLNHHC